MHCPRVLKETDIVKIADWTSKFNHYSDEQVRVVKLCQAKMQEFIKLKENAKWAVTEDKKKDGVKVEVTEIRGFNTFKAYGQVDFPPWVIFRVLFDKRYRKVCEEALEDIHFISKLAENTYTMYQRRGKIGVWPLRAQQRDFVLINHTELVSKNISI